MPEPCRETLRKARPAEAASSARWSSCPKHETSGLRAEVCEPEQPLFVRRDRAFPHSRPAVTGRKRIAHLCIRNGCFRDAQRDGCQRLVVAIDVDRRAAEPLIHGVDLLEGSHARAPEPAIGPGRARYG